MPDKKQQSSFQPPVFGPGPVPGRGPAHRFLSKGAKPKDLKSTLKRLWEYFNEFRLLLFGIFVTVIAGAILQIISPLLIQRAIDGYIVPKKLDGLYKIVLAMIGIYILNSFFAYLQGYGMMTISQKIVFKMRGDLFSKLQRIPIKVFDTRAHGDLMSRLTNDIDVMTNTLNASLTSIFSSIITITGSIIVMLILSPLLTILTLTVVPLMFWLTNLIANKTRKLFSQNQKLLGSLNSIIEEDITGQKVIKVFTREEKEIQKFEKVNRELTHVGIKAQIFSGVIPPLMNLLNNLAFIIVAASGGFLALRSFITVGTIASFIQYARQFTRPLNELANQFNQIQSAFASAERVFEIMDEVEETSFEDEVDLQDIKGEVEFKNVWFSYTKGQPVIKDVSFKVKPGQMVALVGPTGSGKTTIVNLLSRFYDIDSGQILIDGIDIRRINRYSLRRKLGIVLQDTFLFSETVKENIRYGKLSATDDEVILASKMANAHEFIKHLPHGYDTVLTDNGMDLSQGQRQLLAIARAILSDPAILILDEATSNIDTRTEKLVQSAMLKLMQGRTSFVIAHRLSTIRNADLILVIHDGRIVEQGTHDELIANKGFYYNLYISQFAVV
ncbi:ABC transporter related protein [Caldicellulosiruptor owensensis OL]|uniref:ABC transporter related protein n=1 Tax=Caldicellulosiruptor owensensis (strain ATCC 700167 / DSM 13100 / OL) TaxID=632518 RepID=E4Q706_CALOW|nr:ABC transporter ATP-binding protein [Caldicellulosiruptor owensensis]ADQ05686.1 ABC transporter related protein [Caldicellulosiruptor owensensis OL]